MVTWRSLYLELGGLDEKELAVAFNDVDYCLKVWAAGRRVIFTPHAELYHHESATRRLDESREKRNRSRRERDVMRARWRAWMAHDPYYNPNLNYRLPDFSLGDAPLARRPWVAPR
jgi:GT2 family glycosyltransferase